MKIRTAQDVQKLDNRIKEDLGIDVSKYRNEEVVENFAELLIFPQYIIKWVMRPILISLLFYFLGFFLYELAYFEFVLYGIVGLFVFLGSGILLGLIFLIWKIKKDIWGIVDYSLEIMKSALVDMNQVNNQLTIENRKEVLGLLFKGIIHIVTIPLISKAISNKVPIIGRLVNGIIKKVLTIVSDKVKFDEQYLRDEKNNKPNESNVIEIYSNAISSVSSGLEKIMNFTFRVIQFPLLLGLGFFLLLLIVFTYIIN